MSLLCIDLSAALPQVDSTAEENGNIEVKPLYQVENPTLDLDSLVAQFDGHSLLIRLMYIAAHGPSLRVEALALALDTVKNTLNTRLYKVIHGALSRIVITSEDHTQLPKSWQGMVPPEDCEWIERTDKSFEDQIKTLRTDLTRHKLEVLCLTVAANGIKDDCRASLLGTVLCLIKRGDFQTALTTCIKARGGCYSSEHYVDIYTQNIKINFYLRKWSVVLEFVDLLKTYSKNGTNLKCYCLSIEGVALMCMKDYKVAATRFLSCGFVSDFQNDLLSPNMVALYGSLCALATYDWQQLDAYVLGNKGFCQFLETEPQLLLMLRDFHQARYSACMTFLEHERDNLLLDNYLAPHVDSLLTLIRKRGLCQYFIPYMSVDMHKMAEAFNVSVPHLEEELVALILEDQINARIDSHNKVLIASTIDQRSMVFQKILALGRDYQRRTSKLILKAAHEKIQNEVEKYSNLFSGEKKPWEKKGNYFGFNL